MTEHTAVDRAAKARAVRTRQTDNRYADRLRSHGFLVVPPEEIPGPDTDPTAEDSRMCTCGYLSPEETTQP